MENLAKLLKEFQIPEKEYSFEIISNGLINDTYLVKQDGEPTYIFQRININVFSNYKALIHNLDLVLPILKSDMYSEVELCKTKKGDSFYSSSKGEIWRLMTFIKDSVVYNTTDNPKIAFEAGRIVAQFHNLTKGFDANQLQDTLPGFHDIHLRYNQFKNALKNADADKIETAAKAITFVKENISFLLDIDHSKLPARVCHNDTKLNNILFSEDGKALCLIDLDTIMKGVFMYDFGDAIRTIVNAAPEDEKDLDKINFNIKLFEAFVEGLATENNLLNEEEKKMLPRGAVLLPFLHGIRALTDYLENNRYYKVKYETQNLDRSYSLFQFAQLSIDKQEAMQHIIFSKLN
ncbi:MAG: aminoglycoside phosphotransferase family protein [Flavobacteriaceae bacterium]|nr:aminoglycoside phosphotransferase family protein [Flavobacteriaceae bacterium]